MHGHHTSEDEPMADMNLIPLIDIALTLLIILMVTSAFIHRPGVSLKLPQTATREGTPETSRDLTITVTPDGAYHVDGRIETPFTLKQRMMDLAGRDKEARVLIKGDRDVAYARIMDVMDIVRQAGLIHVVLPTDPLTGQAPGVSGDTGALSTPPVVTPATTPGSDLNGSTQDSAVGATPATPPAQDSAGGAPTTAPATRDNAADTPSTTPPPQNR